MAGRGQTVVRVEGARQLRRRLRNIENGLEDLKAEHGWIASYVFRRSVAGAPRRSGRLAASGRSSGTKTASIVRYGGARLRYAGVQHYGWPRRNIEAHPWVIDAAQRTEPIWRAHFEETIATLVERTPE